MFVLLGVKMMLEWREGEHEDMDQEALQSVPTVHVFMNEWVIEIILLITYVGQCLLARVHDKLLGP